MKKILIRNGKVVIPLEESGSITKLTTMNRDILIENSLIKEIAPPFTIDPNGNGTPIIATDRYIMPGIIKTGVHISQNSDLGSLTQNAIESGITSMQFISPEEDSTVYSLEKWVDTARKLSFTNYSFFPVIKDADFATKDLFKFEPDLYPGLFVTDAALSDSLKLEWVFNNIRGFPIAVGSHEYNLKLEKLAQQCEIDLQVISESCKVFIYSELQTTLQEFRNKQSTLEEIVLKNSLNPALDSQIGLRGLIKKGYRADLVIFKMNEKAAIHANKMTYAQGWNSSERLYNAEIIDVLVNGNVVLQNGKFCKNSLMGEKLVFLR